MTPGAWIAPGSLAVLVVVNLSSMVYWGGQIREGLAAVQKELPALRDAKHSHANLLTKVMGDIEALTTMESRVRQDLNNAISSISAHSIQQHGAVTTQLNDIKHSVQSAGDRAAAADERSMLATHRADMAEQKVVALDRLLNARLDHIDDKMKSIENMLRSAAMQASRLVPPRENAG